MVSKKNAEANYLTASPILPTQLADSILIRKNSIFLFSYLI